ncbi:MAG: hypothetical protein ACO1OO_04905 [Flavisolibacter sp.]
MILRFLFYAFLVYLLYKFLFGFVIPIFRTTREVKRNFRHMQDQMNRQAPPNPQGSYEQTANSNKEKPGDYIDFEEIKD